MIRGTSSVVVIVAAILAIAAYSTRGTSQEAPPPAPVVSLAPPATDISDGPISPIHRS